MGQISLPVLNRAGFTNFWSSVWDTSSNYQKFLKEDYLIRLILPVFLGKSIMNTSFFFKKNLFLENSNFIAPSWDVAECFIDSESAFVQIIKRKVLPTYFNKIWIFRFANWIIIFVIYFKTSKDLINLERLQILFNCISDANENYIFQKKNFFIVSVLLYVISISNQLWCLSESYKIWNNILNTGGNDFQTYSF